MSKLPLNNLVYPVSTTIPASGALSNGINLEGVRLFGLDIPATWTTANVVVYQKHADGTYKPVKDETGAELSLTVTAGGCIRFSNPAQFAALTDIKLLSGSTATPVNQAADRSITLVLRAI